MTVEQEEIRHIVARTFERVESVSDSLMRCEEWDKDTETIYSVTFVDTSNVLPTADDLSAYQDQIIAPSYFQGKKSLQWNSYLYFVIDDSVSSSIGPEEAKVEIERDRRYARKFVVTKAEINRLIGMRSRIGNRLEKPSESIYGLWVNRITEEGLAPALLEGGSYPERVKAIELGTGSGSGSSEPDLEELDLSLAFLSSIDLSGFRPFPTQKKFEFGKVNLIHGPNGVGKTSLLEAIEFAYCGKNLRNEGADSSGLYVEVAMRDKTTAIVGPVWDPKAMRRRNLAWYGQADVRKPTLHNSFGRFNFFDTDLAANLHAKSSSDAIRDDLLNLLAGPEASMLWTHIERVGDAVDGRLRELNRDKKAIDDAVREIQERASLGSSVAVPSEIVAKRLQDALTDLEWGDHLSQGDSPEDLIGVVAEFGPAVSRLISHLDGCDPPSKRCAAELISESRTRFARLKSAVAELGQIDSDLAAGKRRRAEIADLVEALDETRDLLATGIVKHVELSVEIKGMLAGLTHAQAVSGDLVSLVLLAKDTEALELRDWLKSFRQKLESAESALAGSRRRYDEYRRDQDSQRSQLLELRTLAMKVLSDEDEHCECPVCQTEFERAELLALLNAETPASSDRHGQELLKQIDAEEEAAKSLRENQAEVSRLTEYCESASVPLSTSVRDVLGLLSGDVQRMNELTIQKDEVDSKLDSLAVKGFTMQALEDSWNRLAGIGVGEVPRSIEAVDQMVSPLQSELDRVSDTVSSISSQMDRLIVETSRESDLSDSSALAIEQACDAERSRLHALEGAYAALQKFDEFSWPDDKSLGLLLSHIESIRDLAFGLQSALREEKALSEQGIRDAERMKEVEEQVAPLNAHLERLETAADVLGGLRENHSLSTGQDEILEENRSAIEDIFLQIHAPAEFKELGSEFGTLVRNSGETATLTEISTGQRAALALAMFLAMNERLQNGPPAIILDDPIAHVDDLNALSFLDYLREVMLQGSRQIFFATADQKLATLFRRKFDFLGDDFQEFSLSR